MGKNGILWHCGRHPDNSSGDGSRYSEVNSVYSPNHQAKETAPPMAGAGHEPPAPHHADPTGEAPEASVRVSPNPYLLDFLLPISQATGRNEFLL